MPASILKTVSPIGLGTYLGPPTPEEDTRYTQTLSKALESGITLFDTAINYRSQRSERVINQVLSTYPTATPIIATKGGYIPLDTNPPKTKSEYRAYLDTEYITPGIMAEHDLVAGGHCIAPRYLLNQIARSQSNLGITTIDLYYLHNPEQQLDTISRADFITRLTNAFEALESAVSTGQIREYGCATWHAFRVPPDAPNHLNLETFVEIAQQVAGADHHFTAIQLPINLAMPEAFRAQTQTINGTPCTLLEAASALGIHVLASAPLMQGQLARNLPPQLREALPQAATDAQRALAFVRQLPGVTSVLVGIRTLEHLDEALQLFS